MTSYRFTPFWPSRRTLKEQLSASVGGFDKDILEKFYALTPDQLAGLLNIYTNTYGDGPSEYARKTYEGWKLGQVRPSAQTINRLLDHLPLVLNFDGKCDLLRRLRERYRKPARHTVRVDVDNWQERVVPLARSVIQKAYLANLPAAVEQRLSWLSNGDMQVARALLAHAQALEGAVAIRLLQHEMQNLEIALTSLTGRRKVSHTIQLPYGHIHLKISRRRRMDKERHNGSELVPQKDTGLFKPNAEDIFDDVLHDLDHEQAAQVKAKAAEEVVRLVAEKKRGEIKYANASRDIANFVDNADLMDQRRKDYQMSAEFEGASGVTRIHVGRNWSRTLLAGGAIVLLVLVIVLYVLRG